MMMLNLAVMSLVAPSALVAVCGYAEPAKTIDAVPYQSVTIGGAFWAPRLEAVREGTLAANRRQCDITGRVANFEKAAKKLAGDATPGEFQGLLFNDSDVYKVMEGWAYLIATEKDAAKKAALDKDFDALVAKIAAAQQPDGYLNTYYQLKVGLDKRFSQEEWDHETYCMGHLIEAAAAHADATGKKNFLAVGLKAAEFLRNLYGPSKFTAPPGHQELELALVKLAKVTGDTKWNDFAHELLMYRGKPHRKLDGSTYGPWGDYCQDHQPTLEQREAAGHAVRAGYMYAAMADLARLGRTEYTPGLDSLWDDITQRRIFVTGGIGPSGHNEGFTVPYDIPTHSAYQETCASIALCLWAHRMFLLEGDAKYMEQFERTLYNAVLAGVSLDGKKFFYVNPMASRGGHQRQDWFACACCPPNVLRFFASMGQYVYAVKGDTVYVNLFMESDAKLKMPGGGEVQIEQKTAYPFDGKIAISVKNPTGKAVTLAIRDGGNITGVKGIETNPADMYGRVTIAAGESKTLEWSAPLEPRRVYSDPRVKASIGRTAIMRGPLVYAAEGVDNGGSIANFVLPPTGAITQTKDASGVPTLVAEGVRIEGSEHGGLYRASGDMTPAKVNLRPYFMWANRSAGDMQVWLPESSQMIDPQPPKGLSFSASFIGNGDGLPAMADRVLPEKSSDGTIPRHTFWPHKGGVSAVGGAAQVGSGSGGEEWVAYEFDKPTKIGKMGVYWFDDTGHGECRVPAKCVAEYLDGKTWKPVPSKESGAVGVTIDTMNTIHFPAVVTTGLRLRVTLPERMSTGILEWEYGQ